MRGFAFARSHRAARRVAQRAHRLSAGRRGDPRAEARPAGCIRALRAIAASFLCFDLGVDWRVGRDEWDRYLIEDAPALAVGNWQWIAGVGADLAAYPRIYNPLQQARRFDPAAQYVRRWIPELAGLPDAAILDPIDGRRRQLAAPALRRSRLSRAGARPRASRARVPGTLRAARSARRRSANAFGHERRAGAGAATTPGPRRICSLHDDRLGDRRRARRRRRSRAPSDFARRRASSRARSRARRSSSRPATKRSARTTRRTASARAPTSIT